MGVAALGVAALGLSSGSLMPAQWSGNSQPPAQTTQAVRLSSVEGQVRIAQDSQLLADPALVNTPLFEGTQVLTSQDGRAELQFEDGSVVRLSPNSSLTLAALNRRGGNGNAEVVLDGGLGYFELHSEVAANQIQVRFGSSVVTASGFAVLRINLDNPPGEIAVFSGNAHLEVGGTSAVDLHGGESVVLNGSDPTQYSLDESIEPDSWDAWNSDRDAALMSAEAARTGAANNLPDRNNPAWNDLDANGNWYNVPDQGYVWSPYEAASPGWDPYGTGYWMWTPRFGYIWVSGASWGYLPYQCGAWNYFNDFGWGWAPGGCNPWWSNGIWVSNIGYAPGGYRLPVMPRPLPPHRPRPLGRPLNGGFVATPNSVVAVNRRPPGGTSGAPVRDRNSIVTIGGHVVQPLSAISSRQQYQGPNSGQMNRSQPAYSGAGTSAAQHPGFGAVSGSVHSGSAPVVRPSGSSQGTPVYSRPMSGSGSPASSSHASSGGTSSSHSSSGGGGGSSHVGGGGSGGGGGGGGSSHSSSSSSSSGSSHR
jgi:hypothetical protein